MFLKLLVNTPIGKQLPFLFLSILLCACSAQEEDHLFKKRYRIARDPTWYPLDLQGKERYVFAFSDDLLMAIAQKEKLQIELMTSSWETLSYGLELHRYDGILSSKAPIAEAAERYSFSEPYLLLGAVLVVPVKTRVSYLEEMEGRIIGVETGSSAVLLASRYFNLNFRSYDNMALALEDLARQQIDGVLLPNLVAQTYCRDLYQGILKVATPPMGPMGLRLLTLKPKEGELLEAFNRGLEALQKDGTYNQLLQKWSLQ